jgi:hypothetical protein
VVAAQVGQNLIAPPAVPRPTHVASAVPPSTFFVAFASCSEAENTEWVACELISCWREEGLEEEADRGEKRWKKVDAAAGSSFLHSYDASVMASMLLSIRPCPPCR